MSEFPACLARYKVVLKRHPNSTYYSFRALKGGNADTAPIPSSCRLHIQSHHLFKRHDFILHVPQFTVLLMSRKTQKPTKSWSMYPSLHNDVSDLLRNHGLLFHFHNNDDGKSCMDEYDTNIMGRFICRNQVCPAQVWTSKKVAITIRRYSNDRYNARVYHQSCKNCGTRSKPKLDHSYPERVAYRLKKWRGVQMDAPPFSSQSGRPHRRDLCEGCKQGHCSGAGLQP